MPRSRLTPKTVAPRFVRMLLSTSWAHCEAVYKRAGVHTISLRSSAFFRETREIPACARLRGYLKVTRESTIGAFFGHLDEFLSASR
jgi:hypothetical protein